MKTLSELGLKDDKALRKYCTDNICTECGGSLHVENGSYYGTHDFIIRCIRNKDHSEFGRPLKTETGDESRINILQRRTELENQGIKTNALSTIHRGAVVTEEYAAKIADILWKGAPDIDKRAAILYCATYNLDPLNNELNLIPFKNKNGGFDYVRVRGIKGDRRIAKNAGDYSYIDDSPRIMTPDEEKRINGEVDKKNMWAVCKTKNMTTGAVSVGYGCWPRNTEPYGEDKGNTKANMARLRAERQCLDRQCPGKLPPVDAKTLVIDDEYMPAVDKATGEIVEGQAREIESPKEPAPAQTQTPGAENDQNPVCPIHKAQLFPNKWGGFSHAITGEKNTKGKQAYCTWKTDELQAALEKQAAEARQKPETSEPIKDTQPGGKATPARPAQQMGGDKWTFEDMVLTANSKYGLGRKDIETILCTKDLEEIKDFKLAYEKIVANQEGFIPKG